MKLFTSHKKLPAFTLLELMVGMIVSTIVLASTFSAWKIVASRTRSFEKSSMEINELSFFARTFKIDASQTLFFISIDETHIELKKSDEEIRYIFAKEYALRKMGAHTDTFFVSVTKYQVLPCADLSLNPFDAATISIQGTEGKIELICPGKKDRIQKLEEEASLVIKQNHN
jgi:Tfp pilus assembly protein PilE